MSKNPGLLTPTMNQNNVEAIRTMIDAKKSCGIWYPTQNSIEHVITDYDHFPYNRWFRGVYYSDRPIVAERQAGWRDRRNNCYKMHCSGNPNPYPKHCFETACSTVYPCNLGYLKKYADVDALNVQVNENCIVQYR